MADDKKHAEIDASLVRQLAEILNETDLTEVEVERGELRIRVAREVKLPAGGAPVRLVGQLVQSHIDGFYALEHPVAWDSDAAEGPPAWWPEHAHISFGYRYATPFSDKDIEAARARVARGPRRARLRGVRRALCRGHFAAWTRGAPE